MSAFGSFGSVGCRQYMPVSARKSTASISAGRLGGSGGVEGGTGGSGGVEGGAGGEGGKAR